MSLDIYLNEKETDEELYWANITHNLNKMASQANIYKPLWRPNEVGVKTASELIEPLTIGLADLKNRPEHYKQFNSPNGWGMYEHFVPFVEKYLNACIDNPEAIVYAST